MARHVDAPGGVPDLGELKHELQQLRRALQGRPETRGTNSTLAVARFVEGLDLPAWRRLAAEMSLDGWYALELAPDGDYGVTRHVNRLADETVRTDNTDALTKALMAAPFLRQLEMEVNRSHRGRSELSLVSFALDRLEEIARDYGQEGIQLAGLELIRCIRRDTLSCDSLGRLGPGQYVLILPGAGAFKAQAMTERIAKIYAATPLHCGVQTFHARFSAGIASGAGSTLTAESLLEQAVTALKGVQHSGGGTVRVCRRPEHPLSERKTLVHSDEKRFLFSGGEE